MQNPRCPTCDYDLRAHASSGVCPECGSDYDYVVPLPSRWTAPRVIWIAVQSVVIAPAFVGLFFCCVLDPARVAVMTPVWIVAAIVCAASLSGMRYLDRVPPLMWEFQWMLLIMCLVLIAVRLGLSMI